MMTDDQRTQRYGRRATDVPGADGDFIRKTDLPGIIRQAVRQALDEYEHECVLALRPGDQDYARDIFQAIRELGHGSLGDGVAEMRENHAFVTRYRKFTGHIGTTIITVILVAIMGIIGSGLVAGGISWVRGLK